MQETSIVTHPQRDAMLRYYDLYWVSQLLRHRIRSLAAIRVVQKHVSFHLRWLLKLETMFHDLLVRIKPKDTLQYIYEMISGL